MHWCVCVRMHYGGCLQHGLHSRPLNILFARTPRVYTCNSPLPHRPNCHTCAQIGTFTLFQETYHRETFRQMHVSGPKSDYSHRLLTQVGGSSCFPCRLAMACLRSCCAVRPVGLAEAEFLRHSSDKSPRPKPASPRGLYTYWLWRARVRACPPSAPVSPLAALKIPLHLAYPLFVKDRAMRAGLDDVGIGTLFGLYDYRFEVLAMLQHSAHLETEYGAGPHTISVPRMRPADGSELSVTPPHVVSELACLSINYSDPCSQWSRLHECHAHV